MTMQTYGLSQARIDKFKGQILKHAVASEVLGKGGRRINFPKNNSKTYVARRWLPYGATAANPNTFYQNGTGDRTNAITQAHLVQEGVTPLPESITPQDVTVVIKNYACLYGFTNDTVDLYEDDIPKAMIEQTGERVTFVNEQIVFGELKACTNQYYGGTGTSRATVNGPITLGMVRKITKNLQANHAKPVTTLLSASGNFGTQAVAPGFFVYAHTNLAPDIRDMPGFIAAELYASGKPEQGELGKVENFRFILTPDLPSLQDAGAAIATWVGSGTGESTSASNLDVYQFIVCGADAWSQIAVRGKESLDPTFIPTGTKTGTDPFGQRGYAGTMWWKAVMIENNGWMAVGNVGSKVVS